MNTKTGLMIKSASAPPSPKPSSCASGHILLVSMQKLRNPAFQRFGADLRKTLMITSVVKQARKFYQLGSDVPINCGCTRAESVFIMPQAASIDTSSMDRVESERKRLISTGDGCDRPSTPAPTVISSRKHSLSSLRKSRKPKTVVAVVSTEKDVGRGDSNNDMPAVSTSSEASQITECPTQRVGGQSNQHSHNDTKNQLNSSRRHQSAHSDINGSHPHNQQQLLIVARYFQLNHHQQSSDDTPPIKKRRLAFLPHEPNSICITASVC